jgi:hypothetical protein
MRAALGPLWGVKEDWAGYSRHKLPSLEPDAGGHQDPAALHRAESSFGPFPPTAAPRHRLTSSRPATVNAGLIAVGQIGAAAQPTETSMLSH